MRNIPNPFDNPTLDGFDILHTSPEIVGQYERPYRALVCRYSDPVIREGRSCDSFILWQEADKDTGEFFVTPGSNNYNCTTMIKILLATINEEN